MARTHQARLVGLSLAAALTAGAVAQPDIHLATEPVTRYDGHKVVRVQIQRARDLQVALALTDDVWTETIRPGSPVDIHVTPEQYAALLQTNLRFEVVVQDIQVAVDNEAAEINALRAADDPQWFTNYHNYTDVKAYVQALAAQYPGLATYQVIGQSLEGRDIFAIRITGPGSTANRPASMWWGGQHAREWINVPVPVYHAEQLLTQYATDPQVRRLVDSVEFLIVPIMNPDGYEYTWTNTRLWRKNRRINTGSSCRGVDLNRNWGFQWGGAGASTNTCSDTYRGTAAFSEPETQVMRDFIIANPRIKTTMDWHSYSQLVMSPWGYTASLPTPASVANQFQALNQQMADAMFAVHGTAFEAGSIGSILYLASGSSVDWCYGARNIWAFTIELRPGRNGSAGFELPPAQITPSCEETWPAFLALAEFAAPCYANCDGSSVAPVLNVNDFTCFLNKFAAGDPAANCDGSSLPPILNVNDFTCFLNKFAAGCD